MTSFLLLLSFFIHLVLFIIIFKMYEQIQQLKQNDSQHLETTLSQFINEIREENKNLERKLIERKDIQKTHTNNNTEKQNDVNDNIYEQTSLIEQVEKNINDDILSTSVESKILQLYAAGKSIEEIARQLNRGKTEVELMIRMNKSNNT